MIEVTVQRIGDSLGVILPAEAASSLKVVEGDKVVISETPEGYRMTPIDPDSQRRLELAEGVMQRYKIALQELAK